MMMTTNKYDILFLIAQAVKSGLPLAEAIRLTIGDRRTEHDRQLLHFAELLDQGLPPKDAVEKTGLPPAIRDLLESALSSNDFSATFDELAEREIERVLIVQKIVQALFYPCLLLFFGAVSVWWLLVFTVPQFEAVFFDFGTELPAMTAGLISLSALVSTPAGTLAIVCLLAMLIFGTQAVFPRFWFCVPILGHVFRCLYSSRFLRQLGSLVRQQVPLAEALDQCGTMMHNRAYRRDCRCAAADARKGMQMAEIVCRYYWLFPAWLAPIVAADGSADSLTKSFWRTAETVDQQRDDSISLVQILTLPLFILVLFLMVSFFVIALFMPLIVLISDLSC